MLARHIDTGHLAIMVEHRAVMRCDDVILFVDSGVWALALAAQRRHHLAAQPRAAIGAAADHHPVGARSAEHTSELQSLMRISYAVFCLKKKTNISHDPLSSITNNSHAR